VEEFLRYVIGSLIENPDEMVLSHTESQHKVNFRLKLRQSDVGKVIGKQGRTIAAIRNLLAAGAARHGQKALLHIDDEK